MAIITDSANSSKTWRASRLTEGTLMGQASDLNSVITSFRGFYATNVVSRVLAAPGKMQMMHNYESIPGAIPIPATLSLELGKVISEQQKNINYRFVSDFPFANRAPHALDAFERTALATLRANPQRVIADVTDSLFSDHVRLVAPIIMGATCRRRSTRAYSAAGAMSSSTPSARS